MSGLFEKYRLDSASVPDQYLQKQVAGGPRASGLDTVQGSCDADLPTGSFGSQVHLGTVLVEHAVKRMLIRKVITKLRQGKNYLNGTLNCGFVHVMHALLWRVSIRNSHMISTLNIKLLLSILLLTFPPFLT